jgi:hypothetical protein
LIEGKNALTKLGIILVLLPLLSFAHAEQTKFSSVVSSEAIDWQNSRAFAGTRDTGPASKEALLNALGIWDGGDKVAPWSTGPAVEEVRHFRIVFQRAVTLQTICLAAGPDSISTLNADVAFPGDVQDETKWTIHASLQASSESQAASLQASERAYKQARLLVATA